MVSDAVWIEITNKYFHIISCVRFYQELSGRYRRRSNCIRLVSLLPLFSGVSLLIDSVAKQLDADWLYVVMGTTIAILVVIELVFNISKNATIFHLISNECNDLEHEWEELFHDAYLPNADEKEIRQRNYRGICDVGKPDVPTVAGEVRNTFPHKTAEIRGFCLFPGRFTRISPQPSAKARAVAARTVRTPCFRSTIFYYQSVMLEIHAAMAYHVMNNTNYTNTRRHHGDTNRYKPVLLAQSATAAAVVETGPTARYFTLSAAGRCAV